MPVANTRNIHRQFVRPLLWSALAAIGIYGISVIVSDLNAVGASALKLGFLGWLLILSLSLTNYVLRFARWQLYINRFDYRVPTVLNLAYYLGGFAFTTTPGKAGEAVRSVYLKRHGIAYVHSLAAFFTERFLDVVSMVLLALFAALSFPDFQWFMLFVTALILALLPLIHSKALHQFIDKQRQRIPSEKLRKLGAQLLDLLCSASDLLKSGLLYIGLTLGLMAWGAEGVAFHIILTALEIPTTLALSVGIYAISVLVGAISFIPGGLGSTEAVMVLILKLVGADTPTAIAATLICRLATLWFAVIIGGIVIGLLELQANPG